MPTDPHANFVVFLLALFIQLTLHSPPFISSHITHDGLPFPPKCQQMQIFIVLINTFDNSCEQLKGLQKRRMKLHLATEGTIMMCFSLFSAEEKLTVIKSQSVSFIFSSKEVSKLNLFEAARCFIHKFLE